MPPVSSSHHHPCLPFDLLPAIWLATLLGSLISSPVFSQNVIVPDDTLGEERSQLQPNVTINDVPSDLIQGGATRGQNLFHSFSEFNVDVGQGAYFDNPAGVAKIFSRVTGNTSSDILGTLGVIGGDADLFLMNPNGILFGEEARLDVEGSFAAITADGIQFGEQGIFSALNPEVPSNLLTVDPSAFLFSQIPTGAITNRSIAPSEPNIHAITTDGLRVPDGENLLLLGGGIRIDGGYLRALGGRIDLGAVGSRGTIGFTADESLTFPNRLEREDIILTNSAFVDVASDDGGEITVTADNLVVSNNGLLRVGLRSTLNDGIGQAGPLIIDATNAVGVKNGFIANNIFPEAVGSGGDIQITAREVDVRNGGSIVTTVEGQGDAGNIFINASDRVSVIGSSTDGNVSDIRTDVFTDGAGNSGDIVLDTGMLRLRDSGELLTTAFGSGNAGNTNKI